MTLYIAGPMTGLPGLNYPAFNRVAEQLRAAGYTVLNPAENPDQDGWEAYMRLSIMQVAEADGLAVLDGWENSRGAKLEVHVAKTLGLECKPAESWIPVLERVD